MMGARAGRSGLLIPLVLTRGTSGMRMMFPY